MITFHEDVFPEHIKYIQNTIEHQFILLEKFTNKIVLTGSYIEINLHDKSFTVTPDFQWLYRKQPTLLTTNELKELLCAY